MAEWREKYNVHTMSLIKEGTMNIIVAFDMASRSFRYCVTFNGVRLQKNITDLEEAKQAGLQFAESMLKRALKECSD